MNRLSTDKRSQIVAALVEGNSIRGTCRMTGAAKNTVTKLLLDLGEACTEYQNKAIRGLTTDVVEADEIWSFVGAKAKNVPSERADEPGIGDCWTWVAIDADTKLAITWLVGTRTPDDAEIFVRDIANRVTNRVQITTDAYAGYPRAVRLAFGHDVDYATIRKLYGSETGLSATERRYSPAACIGIDIKVREGFPNVDRISTSYIERQNLTMRMSMRRFTRLTNAFSKKIENHTAAIALHFMHYNFARKHQTLKTTPAVAAGVADHIWSVSEIVGLMA